MQVQQTNVSQISEAVSLTIQQATPESVCVTDQRIKLTPGQDFCDIEITRVKPSDHGTWNCLLNEIEEVSSDQEQISLEVRNCCVSLLRLQLISSDFIQPVLSIKSWLMSLT